MAAPKTGRWVVTNFREIFNDHIGAHILAFVLAFARGLHIFVPQQFRREWKKSPSERGDVVHLPEATALIEHSKLCEKSGPARPIAISARRFFQRNRRPHAPVAACAGACSLVGIPTRWHLHPWRRGRKEVGTGHSGGSVASAAPAREGPSPVISRTPTSKVKYDQNAVAENQLVIESTSAVHTMPRARQRPAAEITFWL
jgi:hypothetical protein